METQNKFPKTTLHKPNALKTTKIILGLLAVSVCLKTGYGCCQRTSQQKQVLEHERTTMATIIGTKTTDNGNFIFWLNADKDRKTAEGFGIIPVEAAQNMTLTNGATKSLSEWRQEVHPHTIQYNPSTFLPSR